MRKLLVFLLGLCAVHAKIYDLEFLQFERNYLPSALNLFESPFPNPTNLSTRCNAALHNLSRRLEEGDVDAFKMLDANAKFPSGVLRGNLNQFGDFDECLEAEGAKYCLAELDLNDFWKNEGKYSNLRDLVHSDFVIKGKISDVSHRVPNFSIIKWGLCVPKECSPEHIRRLFEEHTAIKARIRPELCQSSHTIKRYGLAEYTTGLLFLGLIVIMLISTFFTKTTKVNNQNEFSYKILQSFNARSNFNTLIKPSESELKGIHGIRALSALALYMSHKAVAQLFGPYSNASTLSDSMSQPWRILGRTAVLHTDTFILIGGLLTARGLIANLENARRINYKNYVIKRLFRILPNLVAVVLFCTYILPGLSSGPLWPALVGHHAVLCKKYMWRNFLFVHNYFGFENMCLNHTHQLGIDFQLFLITPLFVYVLFYWRKAGYILAITSAVASSLLRYQAIRAWDLSYIVYFGIPVSKMFDTATYSYILPSHRATVYLFGVCFSFALKDGCFERISKWKHAMSAYILMAFLPGLLTAVGPYETTLKTYEYNVDGASLYGTFAPVVWSVAVCWTIHASQYDYGGWFLKVITWEKFGRISALTYGVYIVQFPLLFFNISRRKYPSEFDPYTLIELQETVVLIILAIALTLTVEIPFRKLQEKIFCEAQASSVRTDKTK